MHPHAHPISARCAVITLSDTRSESTDTSGSTIRALLAAAGHSIRTYQIIPDDPPTLDALLTTCLANIQVDAILLNGGTGISPRDQTISTIQKHITTPLPGFGELFRMLSYAQVKSAAMLSRACAGIAFGKPVFALPGSTKAVELAMTQLIIPELSHLLSELRKSSAADDSASP